MPFSLRTDIILKIFSISFSCSTAVNSSKINILGSSNKAFASSRNCSVKFYNFFAVLSSVYRGFASFKSNFSTCEKLFCPARNYSVSKKNTENPHKYWVFVKNLREIILSLWKTCCDKLFGNCG